MTERNLHEQIKDWQGRWVVARQQLMTARERVIELERTYLMAPPIGEHAEKEGEPVAVVRRRILAEEEDKHGVEPV